MLDIAHNAGDDINCILSVGIVHEMFVGGNRKRADYLGKYYRSHESKPRMVYPFLICEACGSVHQYKTCTLFAFVCEVCEFGHKFKPAINLDPFNGAFSLFGLITKNDVYYAIDLIARRLDDGAKILLVPNYEVKINGQEET